MVSYKQTRDHLNSLVGQYVDRDSIPTYQVAQCVDVGLVVVEDMFNVKAYPYNGADTARACAEALGVPLLKVNSWSECQPGDIVSIGTDQLPGTGHIVVMGDDNYCWEQNWQQSPLIYTNNHSTTYYRPDTVCRPNYSDDSKQPNNNVNAQSNKKVEEEDEEMYKLFQITNDAKIGGKEYKKGTVFVLFSDGTYTVFDNSKNGGKDLAYVNDTLFKVKQIDGGGLEGYVRSMKLKLK